MSAVIKASAQCGLRSGGAIVKIAARAWGVARGAWLGECCSGRGGEGIDLFVRSDPQQLTQLVTQVDAGQLHIGIAERTPLADLPALHQTCPHCTPDLPALHARATASALPSGKVTITVAA